MVRITCARWELLSAGPDATVVRKVPFGIASIVNTFLDVSTNVQCDGEAMVPGRRTALGIRGSVLKVYSGAAHGLFVTHMDQVNRDILEFINS